MYPIYRTTYVFDNDGFIKEPVYNNCSEKKCAREPPRSLFPFQNWCPNANNPTIHNSRLQQNGDNNYNLSKKPKMHSPIGQSTYTSSSTIHLRESKPPRKRRSHLEDIWRENHDDEYRRNYNERCYSRRYPAHKKWNGNFFKTTNHHSRNKSKDNKITEKNDNMNNKEIASCSVLQPLMQSDKKEIPTNPAECLIDLTKSDPDELKEQTNEINKTYSKVELKVDHKAIELIEDNCSSNQSASKFNVNVTNKSNSSSQDTQTSNKERLFTSNTQSMSGTVADLQIPKEYKLNIPANSVADNIKTQSISPNSPPTLPSLPNAKFKEQSILYSEKLRRVIDSDEETVDFDYRISVDSIDTRKSYLQNEFSNSDLRTIDMEIGSPSPSLKIDESSPDGIEDKTISAYREVQPYPSKSKDVKNSKIDLNQSVNGTNTDMSSSTKSSADVKESLEKKVGNMEDKTISDYQFNPSKNQAVDNTKISLKTKFEDYSITKISSSNKSSTDIKENIEKKDKIISSVQLSSLKNKVAENTKVDVKSTLTDYSIAKISSARKSSSNTKENVENISNNEDETISTSRNSSTEEGIVSHSPIKLTLLENKKATKSVTDVILVQKLKERRQSEETKNYFKDQKAKFRKDRYSIDDSHLKTEVNYTKLNIERSASQFLSAYTIPKKSDLKKKERTLNVCFDIDANDRKQSREMIEDYDRKRRRESSESADSDSTRTSSLKIRKRFKLTHNKMNKIDFPKTNQNETKNSSNNNMSLKAAKVPLHSGYENRKTDTKHSISNKEDKISHLIEKYAKEGSVEIVMEKILPLPTFSFPSKFRNRFSIVHDDCTDEVAILESPEILDKIEIIAKNLKELDDVIEIKEDIPFIDLTTDKPEHSQDKPQVDIKVEVEGETHIQLDKDVTNVKDISDIKKQLINILEGTDETITLYRDDETVNSRLDIQATSMSISASNAQSYKSLKCEEETSTKSKNLPEIIRAESKADDNTDNILNLSSTGVSSKNLYVQDTNLPPEIETAVCSTLNEQTSFTVPIVTPIGSSAPPKQTVANFNQDGEVAVTVLTGSNLPLHSNCNEPIQPTVMNNTNSVLNNNVSNIPHLNCSPASNNTVIVNNQEAQTKENTSSIGRMYDNTSVESILNPHYNRPAVAATTVDIPTTNESISVKSPEALFPIASNQSLLLQPTEPINTLQRISMECSTNQNPLTLSSRSSVNNTQHYGNNTSAGQMRNVVNIFVQFICFYDSVKKGERAYEEEIKKIYRVSPSLVKMELVEFCRKQNLKLISISQSMAQKLSRVCSIQYFDTRTLVRFIFYEIQKKLPSFTETWFFIILHQLMNPQMEFYNTNTNFKLLLDYIRIHAEQIYVVGHRNQLQHNSVKNFGLNPQQMRTLQTQIAQYEAIRIANDVAKSCNSRQTNTTIVPPTISQNVVLSTKEHNTNINQSRPSTNLNLPRNELRTRDSLLSEFLKNSVNQTRSIRSVESQSVHLTESNISIHRSTDTNLFPTSRDVQNCSAVPPPYEATVHNVISSLSRLSGTNSTYAPGQHYPIQVTSHNKEVDKAARVSSNLSPGYQMNPSNISTQIQSINSIAPTQTTPQLTYSSNYLIHYRPQSQQQLQNVVGNYMQSSNCSQNYSITTPQCQLDQNQLHIGTLEPTLPSSTISAKSTIMPSSKNSPKSQQINQKTCQNSSEDIILEKLVDGPTDDTANPINPVNHCTEPLISPTNISPMTENVVMAAEPPESEIIDLTWINDVDPIQIQQEISLVIKEEVEESSNTDEDEVILNQEQFPDDCNELVQIERLCICEKPAHYVCGCRMVMYCSVICQNKDWKSHKAVCLKYTSQKSGQ